MRRNIPHREKARVRLHPDFLQAIALYTTQSSVSKVIKSLEDELGMRLFERRHDGITLTEEGDRVYRDVRPILDRLNRLQQGRT